jgi:alkyl hydroperoxide reductase subunit AhpC
MTLQVGNAAPQIGSVAPDFQADTTEGRIRFHEWIGDSWAVLFSHPKDFTPVCTTELGYMAKLKPEFEKRNTKVIGLSVDTVEDHKRWAADIEATQGHAPNYPMIGDPNLEVSKLYGMLAADLEGSCAGRTPADNQTVRNVYVIGPDRSWLMSAVGDDGRNFDEVLRVGSLQRKAQGLHARERAGRGRVGITRLGLGRGSEEEPARLGAAAGAPHRAATESLIVQIRRGSGRWSARQANSKRRRVRRLVLRRVGQVSSLHQVFRSTQAGPSRVTAGTTLVA